jgi:hypothetical protein
VGSSTSGQDTGENCFMRSFVIYNVCASPNNIKVNYIKERVIGSACSRCWFNGKCTQNFSRIPRLSCECSIKRCLKVM